MKSAIAAVCMVLGACGGRLDATVEADEAGLDVGKPGEAPPSPCRDALVDSPLVADAGTDGGSGVCVAPLTGSCVTRGGLLCTEHRSSGVDARGCAELGGAWAEGAPCPLDVGGCALPTNGGGCTVDVWSNASSNPDEARAACEASGGAWVTP